MKIIRSERLLLYRFLCMVSILDCNLCFSLCNGFMICCNATFCYRYFWLDCSNSCIRHCFVHLLILVVWSNLLWYPKWYENLWSSYETLLDFRIMYLVHNLSTYEELNFNELKHGKYSKHIKYNKVRDTTSWWQSSPLLGYMFEPCSKAGPLYWPWMESEYIINLCLFRVRLSIKWQCFSLANILL